MDFKIGIVIGASLWLVTEQQGTSRSFLPCTNLSNTSVPCGCLLSRSSLNLTCGSDGYTYFNLCFLGCENAVRGKSIKVAHKGLCKRQYEYYMQPICICHTVYEPVCGTDKVTYPNICVLKCFIENLRKREIRLKLQYHGECASGKINLTTLKPPEEVPLNERKSPKKTEVPQRPSPARLTQASNRPGSCQLNNRSPIQRTSPGCPNQSPTCPLSETTDIKKRCRCLPLYNPVCDNNRRTYANYCALHCSSTRDPSVKFASWGRFCK